MDRQFLAVDKFLELSAAELSRYAQIRWRKPFNPVISRSS